LVLYLASGNFIFNSYISSILFRKDTKFVNKAESNYKPNISASNQNIGKYFRYKGLSWKRGRFGFHNPTPVCPIDHCLRPVDCFRINPPQYLISADVREMQDFLNKQNTFRFIYRCPLHGDIQGTPNESLNDLT